MLHKLNLEEMRVVSRGLAGYAGFVGHRLLVSINTTWARPWGNVGGRGHRRVRGRTAVPLIVICQCAVVRRVVAP